MAGSRETTEVRKAQIAASAIEVIGQDGLRGFTTAAAAKKAGISEANLYRHFKNKEAILSAVIDSIEDTLSGNIKLLANENIPSAEKLKRAFVLHLAYIQRNPGIPRIVFSSEFLFARSLQKRLLKLISGYSKLLSGIIENGIRDRSIGKNTSPDAAAAMFIGTIQFNALRWLLGGFKYSLEQKADTLWQSYKKNIEPKSAGKKQR